MILSDTYVEKEFMQTKHTRVAYLKRMLKRLEGEEKRIRQLAVAGELSPEGEALSVQQVNNSRDELLSELRKLETDDGGY